MKKKIRLALKKFNLRKAQTDKQKEMMQSSIDNSKQALKKLNRIFCPETFNTVIWQLIDSNNWSPFINVLSTFSGSLNDERLYDYDKKLYKEKLKDMN